MKPAHHDDDATTAGEAADSIKEFLHGCDRFLFTPSDPTTLGLMRVMSGIVILYTYFCYSYDLRSYVSSKYAWIDQKALNFCRREMPVVDVRSDFPDSRKGESNFIVVAQGQDMWSIFLHLDDRKWIWTAHWVILFVMFLFTIGFATRITSVLTFLGAVSYIWRVQTSLFGIDAIIVVLLFYMMIAPCGAALSIDRWFQVDRERRRLGNPNAVVPLQPLVTATLATRLMQVHFCFIYFAAGTSKLLGAAWWNGNALWGCYANYSFAPMRVPLYMDFLYFLLRHRWLWEIFMSGGAAFTLFMELGFPFLIWNRRWRWIMLTGSVMLHTGIGLFMGLVTFSLAMLCLVLSFVPPEATRIFLARLADNCRHVWQAIFGPSPAPKPLPAPAQ